MEECIACYLVGSPKNSAQEERISRPFIVPGDTDALVCKHKNLTFEKFGWVEIVGRNWGPGAENCWKSGLHKETGHAHLFFTTLWNV